MAQLKATLNRMQEKRVTAQELFEPDTKYDELLRALAEKDNLIQQLTV